MVPELPSSLAVFVCVEVTVRAIVRFHGAEKFGALLPSVEHTPIVLVVVRLDSDEVKFGSFGTVDVYGVSLDYSAVEGKHLLVESYLHVKVLLI